MRNHLLCFSSSPSTCKKKVSILSCDTSPPEAEGETQRELNKGEASETCLDEAT